MLPRLSGSTESARLPEPVAPSATSPYAIPALNFLDGQSARAMDFGTLVHALLEQVAWNPLESMPEIEAAWTPILTRAGPLADGAEACARAVLQAPQCGEAFTRPRAGTELWRERGFDVLLPDGRVRGIIDRAHIIRESDPAEARVTIIDFKTDSLQSETPESVLDRHRHQLTLYAQAVARLLGIQPRQIKAGLLLTAEPQLIWL